MEKRRRLSRVSESHFAAVEQHVKRVWKEIDICLNSQAYLAGLALCGAFLEGLLLAFVLDYPDREELEKAVQRVETAFEKSLPSSPLRWTLEDLLEVAFEAGWIPYQGDGSALGDWLKHYVKDLRNWIHPGFKAREYPRSRVTKKRLEEVRELVEMATGLLLERIEAELLREAGEHDDNGAV